MPTAAHARSGPVKPSELESKLNDYLAGSSYKHLVVTGIRGCGQIHRRRHVLRDREGVADVDVSHDAHGIASARLVALRAEVKRAARISAPSLDAHGTQGHPTALERLRRTGAHTPRNHSGPQPVVVCDARGCVPSSTLTALAKQLESLAHAPRGEQLPAGVWEPRSARAVCRCPSRGLLAERRSAEAAMLVRPLTTRASGARLAVQLTGYRLDMHRAQVSRNSRINANGRGP